MAGADTLFSEELISDFNGLHVTDDQESKLPESPVESAQLTSNEDILITTADALNLASNKKNFDGYKDLLSKAQEAENYLKKMLGSPEMLCEHQDRVMAAHKILDTFRGLLKKCLQLLDQQTRNVDEALADIEAYQLQSQKTGDIDLLIVYFDTCIGQLVKWKQQAECVGKSSEAWANLATAAEQEELQWKAKNAKLEKEKAMYDAIGHAYEAIKVFATSFGTAAKYFGAGSFWKSADTLWDGGSNAVTSFMKTKTTMKDHERKKKTMKLGVNRLHGVAEIARNFEVTLSDINGQAQKAPLHNLKRERTVMGKVDGKERKTDVIKNANKYFPAIKSSMKEYRKRCAKCSKSIHKAIKKFYGVK